MPNEIVVFFKKHPWETGGGVVALVFLIYLLTHPRASGSTSGGDVIQGTTAPAVATGGAQNGAYALQIAQIAAASQAATNATQAQVQQAQIASDTAKAQSSDALAAAKYNADATTNAYALQAQAALAAAQTQAARDITLANVSAGVSRDNNATSITVASMQDQVNTASINAALAAHLSDNATSVTNTQTAATVETNVSQLQAAVALNNTNKQAEVATAYNAGALALAQQQQQDQTKLKTQLLATVDKAGLNHGTASLESQLVNLAGGIISAPTVSAVAGQIQTANAASSAASDKALFGSIASLGQSIAKIPSALFS